MKDVLIYGLVDPRTSELRYVGKTTRSLPKRLSGHIVRTNLTPKRHSSRWIAGVVKDGLAPEIFEIERVRAGDDWQAAEQFWIAYFRAIGADLTNLANGGEGVGGVRLSAERRRELSERFKGRVFDDEWRAKISAAKKGKAPKPLTPESQAKRLAAVAAAKARKAAARTHCRHGHELSPENTYRNGNKWSCRACKRESWRATSHLRPPSRLTKEERSERTRAGMRKPGVAEKLRQALVECWRNPDWRANQIAKRKGKPSKIAGENNTRAKLNWEKVADIRARCAAGEYRYVLAKEYGVCPAVVDRIIWNQTWKLERTPK
jgi:hypothetical protein